MLTFPLTSPYTIPPVTVTLPLKAFIERPPAPASLSIGPDPLVSITDRQVRPPLHANPPGAPQPPPPAAVFSV